MTWQFNPVFFQNSNESTHLNEPFHSEGMLDYDEFGFVQVNPLPYENGMQNVTDNYLPINIDSQQYNNGQIPLNNQYSSDANQFANNSHNSRSPENLIYSEAYRDLENLIDLIQSPEQQSSLQNFSQFDESLLEFQNLDNNGSFETNIITPSSNEKQNSHIRAKSTEQNCLQLQVAQHTFPTKTQKAKSPEDQSQLQSHNISQQLQVHQPNFQNDLQLPDNHTSKLQEFQDNRTFGKNILSSTEVHEINSSEEQSQLQNQIIFIRSDAINAIEPQLSSNELKEDPDLTLNEILERSMPPVLLAKTESILPAPSAKPEDSNSTSFKPVSDILIEEENELSSELSESKVVTDMSETINKSEISADKQEEDGILTANLSDILSSSFRPYLKSSSSAVMEDSVNLQQNNENYVDIKKSNEQVPNVMSKKEIPNQRLSLNAESSEPKIHKTSDKNSCCSSQSGSATSKSKKSELKCFFKGEYIAVRNEEETFFLCQALQNIVKFAPTIRIYWLKQDKNKVYTKEFIDYVSYASILTSVNLIKVGKEKFILPQHEETRINNILQKSLAATKGEHVPLVTEENPDGLDLSLYTNEKQLNMNRTPAKCKSKSQLALRNNRTVKTPLRSNIGKQLNQSRKKSSKTEKHSDSQFASINYETVKMSRRSKIGKNENQPRNKTSSSETDEELDSQLTPQPIKKPRRSQIGKQGNQLRKNTSSSETEEESDSQLAPTSFGTIKKPRRSKIGKQENVLRKKTSSSETEEGSDSSEKLMYRNELLDIMRTALKHKNNSQSASSSESKREPPKMSPTKTKAFRAIIGRKKQLIIPHRKFLN